MLKAVLATLILIGSAASVRAAEPISVPIDSSGRGVPLASGAADWSGFYAGVYGTVAQDGEDSASAGLGLSVGANAQIDFVLVGAEVSLQGLTAEAVDTAYGEVVGRTGLVLNDDILLYAAAGYGWDLAGGGDQILAGGGVEFAVNDDVSVNAQYLRGFDQSGDAPSDQFALGARFHF